MKKTEAIERLNTIKENSCTYDYCELTVEVSDWEKGDKNRTYFKIVEKAVRCSKHYKVKDYGYLDNVTGEYFPSKNNDLRNNFTFSGSAF